jgi:hypothetical protein
VRHGPEPEKNKQGKEIVKFADGLANVACGIVQAGDRVFYQQDSKRKFLGFSLWKLPATRPSFLEMGAV